MIKNDYWIIVICFLVQIIETDGIAVDCIRKLHIASRPKFSCLQELCNGTQRFRFFYGRELIPAEIQRGERACHRISDEQCWWLNRQGKEKGVYSLIRHMHRNEGTQLLNEGSANV